MSAASLPRASVPLPAPGGREMSDLGFALTVIIAVYALNTLIIGVPLGYSFWLSLHDTNAILRTQEFVGADLYAEVLSDSAVTDAIWRSLGFVAMCVAGSFVAALGIALVLNEDMPLRGLVRGLALLPWAMSQVVTATVFSFLLNPSFGALTGLLAPLGLAGPGTVWLSSDWALFWVALAFVWHVAPLGSFFYLAALQTIPRDLYRAARVDGAGPLARFRHITLPHLKHTTLIVLVVMTVEAVRQFDLLFSLTRGGPGTSTQILPLLIFRYNFEFSKYGLASAAAFLLTVLSLLLATAYFMLIRKKRPQGGNHAQ